MKLSRFACKNTKELHNQEGGPFFWLEYIRKRIRDNKNFLAIWCGQTGSGKSLSAIRMAELLDNDFCPEQIVFNPLDFMKLIRGKTLKPGSAIVFDETGVEGMSARNWYSEYNKMMNYVLQTFRYMGIIVFFTVPDLKFVDGNARKLLHAYFEPVKIYKTQGIALSKAMLVENNPHMGKIYYKYLKGTYRGHAFKINRVSFGLPSSKLLKAYEIKKRGFAETLYKKVMENLVMDDTKGKGTSDDKDDKRNFKDALSQRQKEVYELLQHGYANKEIAQKLGIKSTASISSIKRVLAKKGYYITKKV